MSEEVKNDLLKFNLQYGDWEGLVEADMADFCMTMQNYLVTHFEQFNAKRYHCKGCRIYISHPQRGEFGFHMFR